MVEVLKLLFILALLVIANMALGTWNNINLDYQRFDWKKLVKGAIKGLIVAFAFFVLFYAFQELPLLAEGVGVEPRAILIAGITIYATAVVAQLNNIFKKKSAIEPIVIEEKV